MSDLFRERWIWFSFGAAVVFASATTILLSEGIRTAKRQTDTSDDSATEPHTVPSQDIPISALRTLVASPVPNISSAAVALADKRLGDKKTYRALIKSVRKDLNSNDEELRRRAETGMRYLDAFVSMSYLPPRQPSIASTTSPSDESFTAFREQSLARQDDQSPVRRQSRQRTPHAPADREQRRRRREAMLFHEGSGELSEGDIIELNTALAEIAMDRVVEH